MFNSQKPMPSTARTGRKAVATALMTGLLSLAGAANAATIDPTIDPEVLFIGNSACPTPPGCPVFGTEVNGIGSLSLTISENGNGQPALADPLLLILGFVNTSPTTLPSITLSTGTGTADGGNVYPSNTTKWDANGIALNTFTSGSVYNSLALQKPASASESFTNWSAAELSVLGITANFFTIGVYELTGTGISGGDVITVNFASDLPIGTFAVAYGCDPNGIDPTTGACTPPGNVFGTPFTQSGLVTHRDPSSSSGPVPEPGTLGLVGIGILGGLLAYRHRRQIRA